MSKPYNSLFRMMARRRIISTLLVMAILFVFFGSALIVMRQYNDKTFRAHQQEKVEQMVLKIEEDIARIHRMQYALLNLQDVQKLIYMYRDLDWYTRYKLLTAVHQQLYDLVDSQIYAQEAYLYIPTLSRFISHRKILAEPPEWMVRDGWAFGLQIGYSNGMLTSVLSNTMPGNGENSAAYGVRLDIARIEKDLSYLRTGEDDLVWVSWDAADNAGLPKSVDHQMLDRDSIHYKGHTYQVVSVDGELMEWTVYQLIAQSGENAFVNQMLIMMLAFVLVTLLVEIASLTQWYYREYRPLSHLLIDAFGKAEEGDLSYRIEIDENSAFHRVYTSYNRMMAQMEAYVENNLKQQILVSRANLKQLQAQISPHFMYNSYYVLYRLIKKGDQESSILLAENLGQFYHYVTRNADDEKRLREEVEHARTYASIQQFRFREMLQLSIDNPPFEIENRYVPRLILQPILENAFKYAYETNNDGSPMQIRIRYEILPEGLFDIIVENSGNVDSQTILDIRQRLEQASQQEETTALVNIHRRLQIYFGSASRLWVEQSALGGLLVGMHIDDRAGGM